MAEANRIPPAGGWVGARVVDPRHRHLHHTPAGQHLPRLVIAIAHHQAVAVLALLTSEPGNAGIHLGGQRFGQHPPRVLPHNPIDQRRRDILAALMARAVARDYGEHRVVPSRPARQRRSLLETSTRTPGRYTPPRPIHRFQALLRSLKVFSLAVRAVAVGWGRQGAFGLHFAAARGVRPLELRRVGLVVVKLGGQAGSPGWPS
jgi:hypothetical protein